MAGDDVLIEAPAKTAESDFKPGTTLDNLQAAFNGEMNAHAKYLAYSKKADEEGFGAVASLFRAAARAEQIHAENHADVIRSLGAEPTADVKLPEIKTTADNLKDAVAGESFERDVMYPAYLNIARRDRNREALRTFNYAQSAEAQHAQYYTEAGEKLMSYKDSTGVTWYVCPTCGETMREDEMNGLSKCPVCFTRTSTFIAVK
ncbi:rubrerythrin [bacterium]|nr:rubrerythrin [bacterium]